MTGRSRVPPPPEPSYFTTAAQWRQWLQVHHASASECVVGYYKTGSGRRSITWPESVDEALCFGWIDGVRRRVDGERYTIRFTPRKPGSNWSRVNVEKMQRLQRLGLVHPAGEAAFAARRADRTGVYSFESPPAQLEPDELAQFAAHPGALQYFEAQAAWYRRTAVFWVVSAKRPQTRAGRLATLIADSDAGRRLRQLSRDQRQ